MVIPDPIFIEHIVNAMTTIVLVIRDDGITLFANPHAEVFFEQSKTKLIGQSIFNVFVERDKQTHVLKKDLAETIRIAQQQNQPFTRRESIIRVQFHNKLADYTVTPLHYMLDASQELEHPLFLIEIQPIERLHNIAREEKLTFQHQVTRQMIRGVAHEIKNPLGGIQGATQLLERLVDDEAIKEYTRVIQSEVTRLKTLVNSLLGSDKMLHPVSTNIHEPIEHVIRLLQNQIANGLAQYPDKSLISPRIQRDYDLSLPEIMVDRHQLVQVLLNISVNALQAIQDHPDFFTTESARILFKTRVHRMMTLQGTKHRTVMRIDIVDNGVGIPPEMIDHIFYPLMTGRAEGTGLGLSIAQNIIYQHKGLITCQSRVGETIFSIYLPWTTTL